MSTFTTEVTDPPLQVYIPDIRRTITFTGGSYSTTDSRELDVLRAHPLVVEDVVGAEERWDPVEANRETGQLARRMGGVRTNISVESTGGAIDTFHPTFLYTAGRVIKHEGVLYEAAATFTSGSSFSPTDWAPISGEAGATGPAGTVDGTSGVVMETASGRSATVALDAALGLIVTEIVATPADIDGLVAWCRPEELPADGLAIDTWPAAAVGLPDLTQGTAGNRPVVSSDELAGRAAAVFDGVDDVLTATGVALGTAGFTMFAVCRMDGDSGRSTVMSYGSVPFEIGWNEQPGKAMYGSNVAVEHTTTIQTGSWRLLIATRHEATDAVTISCDGVAVSATDNSATLASPGTLSLGSRATPGVLPFLGRVSEWGAVDHAVDADELAIIKRYIAYRTGLAVI